jgi:hypothetical protein
MWGALDWTLVGALASSVSALVAVVGFIYLFRQIRMVYRVASADFMLRLERQFADYVDTYEKLRPGGAWSSTEQPLQHLDVVKLISYLNFFASLHVILSHKFMDLRTIDKMFAYRFFIAMHNPHVIKQVLEGHFLYLGQVLALYEEWMQQRKDWNKEVPQTQYEEQVRVICAKARARN